MPPVATADAVVRSPAALPSDRGLVGTWHRPPAAVRGVAIVAPGVAVPARVVTPLADFLAESGWLALSLEFPGIASSPVPPRAVVGGMAEWGSRDLDDAIRLADAEAGGRPVVLVGHSAGAWLSALTPRAARLDAVVAIASMSGYWRDLKRAAWPQLVPSMFGLIDVAGRAFGYLPHWLGLGEDAPGGPLAQWAGWCRRADFLFGAPGVVSHEDLLDAPVLVLLPSDDAWATPTSVERLWSRFGNADVTVRTVTPDDGQGIGHLGLLRDRFADTIWSDLAAWLDAAVTQGSAAAAR